MAVVGTSQDWIPERDVHELSRVLGDPATVRDRRADAFRLYQALPLEPNPLYRQYGYFQGVNLQGIRPSEAGPPVPLPPALAGAVRIVHDSAGTRVELPTRLAQAGVRIQTLSQLWSSTNEALSVFLQGIEVPSDRLSALGLALLNRGYSLSVPDQFTEPLRIQDVTILSQVGEALSVRRSIRAGSQTQLLMTEEVYSSGSRKQGQRLYASSTDIVAGPDAKVVALSAHAPDRETVSIYQRQARAEARARLAWIWVGLGGRTTKVRNTTLLAGDGSNVHDLQTFYGDRSQSYDSAINLTHIGTDTRGESITRGVFKDEARGMSRGLVRIEKDARKTLSFISEHAMLLSRGARSDTIPILEILCRDVKATHSTSVAPVDPEKIFYLESRGVPEADAVQMVSEGFLAHVYERAPVGDLADALHPLVATRWGGDDVEWSPDHGALLPALDVSGTDLAPEWRFDAKLR